MEINVQGILEEVVKRSGLEQDKFAESLGLKKAAFNNYIKGRRELPKEVIVKLMHQYNVNPQVFFDPEVNLYLPKKNKISEKKIYRQIPLYGDVAAGALASVDGVIADNVAYIDIPGQFLGKYSSCSDLFSMIVNGESMNKIINHRSIVVAKPLELNHYKDGDIVIFSYNNEYSLKRFSPNELDGYVLFKSESTDPAFKDIPIPVNAINELKIYGKVIFYGNVL